MVAPVGAINGDEVRRIRVINLQDKCLRFLILRCMDQVDDSSMFVTAEEQRALMREATLERRGLA